MRKKTILAGLLAVGAVFLMGQSTRYPASKILFGDGELLQTKWDAGEVTSITDVDCSSVTTGTIGQLCYESAGAEEGIWRCTTATCVGAGWAMVAGNGMGGEWTADGLTVDKFFRLDSESLPDDQVGLILTNSSVADNSHSLAIFDNTLSKIRNLWDEDGAYWTQASIHVEDGFDAEINASGILTTLTRPTIADPFQTPAHTPQMSIGQGGETALQFTVTNDWCTACSPVQPHRGATDYSNTILLWDEDEELTWGLKWNGKMMWADPGASPSGATGTGTPGAFDAVDVTLEPVDLGTAGFLRLTNDAVGTPAVYDLKGLTDYTTGTGGLVPGDASAGTDVLTADGWSAGSGSVTMTPTPTLNYFPVFDNGALPAQLRVAGFKTAGGDDNELDWDASAAVATGGLKWKEGSDNGTNQTTLKGAASQTSTKAYVANANGVAPSAFVGSKLVFGWHAPISVDAIADMTTTLGATGTQQILKTNTYLVDVVENIVHENSGFWNPVVDSTGSCQFGFNCQYAAYEYDPPDGADRDFFFFGNLYTYSDTALVTDVSIEFVILTGVPANPESDDVLGDIAVPLLDFDLNSATPTGVDAEENMNSGFVGWAKLPMGGPRTIEPGEVLAITAKQVSGSGDDVELMFELFTEEDN